MIHLNTYVMGLRPLAVFSFFQSGDRLYMSESDVYRRQILTYRDDPRSERLKILIPNEIYRPNTLCGLCESG